jgi:hypothetical protein
MKNELLQLLMLCWLIALAALFLTTKLERPIRRRRYYRWD